MPKFIILVCLLLAVTMLPATLSIKYVNYPNHAYDNSVYFSKAVGIYAPLYVYNLQHPTQTNTDTLKVIVYPDYSNNTPIATYVENTSQLGWSSRGTLIITAESYPASGANANLYLVSDLDYAMFNFYKYGSSEQYGRVTISGFNITQAFYNTGEAIYCNSRDLSVLNCNFTGVGTTYLAHAEPLEYRYSEADSYSTNTSLQVSYCTFVFPTMTNHLGINAYKADSTSTAFSYSTTIDHCNFDKCGNGAKVRNTYIFNIHHNNFFNSAGNEYTGIRVKQIRLTGGSNSINYLNDNELKRFGYAVDASVVGTLYVSNNKIFAYRNGINATTGLQTLSINYNLVIINNLDKDKVIGISAYHYNPDTAVKSNASIFNNTVDLIPGTDDCDSRGMLLTGNAYASSATSFANNIIWDFDCYLEETTPLTTAYYFCTSGSVTSNDLLWGRTGCTTSNPLFDSPNQQLFVYAYDSSNHWGYDLTSSSPCIDTGSPTLTDPDGTRRDMGCFYYPQRGGQQPQHGTPAAEAAIVASNYPNPFNPRTTIKYTVPKAGRVKVEVFNSRGQKVRELVNEDQKPGDHTVAFEGNNLASGMYLYRIQAAGQTVSGKMIMVK